MKFKRSIALLSCLILLTCLPGCSKQVGPSDEQVIKDLLDNNAETHKFLLMEDFRKLDNIKITGRKKLGEGRVEVAYSSRVSFDVAAAKDILFRAKQKGQRLPLNELPKIQFVAGLLSTDEDNDGVFIADMVGVYRKHEGDVWVFEEP